MDLMVLGAIPFWVQALAVFFTIICLLLIVLVLLQKGRGGGLSAAFGGAGGQSAFGSKTGDVFTWVTVVVVAVFLLLSMVLTKYYKPKVEFQEDIAVMQSAPSDTAPAADTTVPVTENAADEAVPAAPKAPAVPANNAADDSVPGEETTPQ